MEKTSEHVTATTGAWIILAFLLLVCMALPRMFTTGEKSSNVAHSRAAMLSLRYDRFKDETTVSTEGKMDTNEGVIDVSVFVSCKGNVQTCPSYYYDDRHSQWNYVSVVLFGDFLEHSFLWDSYAQPILILDGQRLLPEDAIRNHEYLPHQGVDWETARGLEPVRGHYVFLMCPPNFIDLSRATSVELQVGTMESMPFGPALMQQLKELSNRLKLEGQRTQTDTY